MTDLTDKLAGEKAGSRELDVAVINAVFGLDITLSPHFNYWEPQIFGQTKDVPYFRALKSSRFTTSLDAIVGLIEGKLPGVWIKLGAYHEGVFAAHAWLIGPSHKLASDIKVWGEAHMKPQRTDGFKHAHALYPLALCIALLRALKAHAHD